MTDTTAASSTDGIAAITRSATPRRPTEAATPAAGGSTGGRLLAAVRAWVAAGQLGPDRDTTVGRYTGARC